MKKIILQLVFGVAIIFNSGTHIFNPDGVHYSISHSLVRMIDSEGYTIGSYNWNYIDAIWMCDKDPFLDQK